MMDDYDSCHITNYKNVINFYCGDLESDIKTGYVIDDTCVIDTIKNSVTINNRDFFDNVLKTVYKLKNGLEILDNRTITNIGARIMFNNTWYLVQVWRGCNSY